MKESIRTFFEVLATFLLIFGGAFAIVFLTGCASNILVSNCREVQVQGDSKKRWVCDKQFSDQWR